MKILRLTLIILMLFSAEAISKVTIGTPIFDPPFATNQKDNLSGFDIDLMKLICNNLNWDCEFKGMNYVDLLAALDNQQIDFIIGGVIITPHLKDNYLISLPYMISEASFLIIIENPAQSLNDLVGKRIGAVKGRGYLEYLESFPVPITPVPYSTFADLAYDLKNKKIDAAFINYYSALYLAHEFPDFVKVLAVKFSLGEGLGIISTQDHQEQMDQINQQIIKFQTNGVFSKLYDYNFQFFIKNN